MIGPKDGLLYVTTELDQTITIIDPKTLKIVGSIPTGQPESHMLALSHDGRRAYTANVGPGTVSVIDMQARKVLKIIPISSKHAAHLHLARRQWVFTADQTKPQLASSTPPRTPSPSGSRWKDRLRYRAHARWPLAPRRPPRPEQGRSHRPQDHAGAALSPSQNIRRRSSSAPTANPPTSPAKRAAGAKSAWRSDLTQLEGNEQCIVHRQEPTDSAGVGNRTQ